MLGLTQGETADTFYTLSNDGSGNLITTRMKADGTESWSYGLFGHSSEYCFIKFLPNTPVGHILATWRTNGADDSCISRQVLNPTTAAVTSSNSYCDTNSNLVRGLDFILSSSTIFYGLVYELYGNHIELFIFNQQGTFNYYRTMVDRPDFSLLIYETGIFQSLNSYFYAYYGTSVYKT
jgi:hypothetical protein